MVKNRMEWKDIRHALGFAPRTITKLKTDQVVDMEIIIRVCEYFDCGIEDVMELLKIEDNL